MSETEQGRQEPADEQTGMTFSLKDIVAIGQVLALLGTFAAGVTAWNNVGNDIARIDREIAVRAAARDNWVTNHEQLHKDRLAEVSKREGAVDQRLDGLATQVRKLDELTFRVGAAEQSQKLILEAVSKLETKVNDQSADLRVIREILERQAGQSQQVRPR